MALEPTITNISNDGDNTTFTLSDVNVSYANAVRRTIIADIPTVVFITSPHDKNKAIFIANTTQLHNEILKQRLSCIPIHIDGSNDIRNNLKNYLVEVDVENTTDTAMYVTTKDFKIKDLTTGEYVDDNVSREIFPSYIPPTGNGEYYIDFVRLAPKVSAELSGGKLHMTCEMSVACARDNSMFNVTGTCAYGCTPDPNKMSKQLEIQKQKWKDENNTSSEIAFEEANWKLLEGLRHVVDNSFDFTIQTVGVYENAYIIEQACNIVISKLIELDGTIDDDSIIIKPSNNIVENCYDITLVNEDYTIGNMLNYEIYALFYSEMRLVDFVGYNKAHPHDADSILKISLTDKTQSVDNIKTILKKCIERSIKNLTGIRRYFKS